MISAARPPVLDDAFAVRRPGRRLSLFPLTRDDWSVFVLVAAATFTIVFVLVLVAS